MSSHLKDDNKKKAASATTTIKMETGSLSTNDDEWTIAGPARSRTKSTTATVTSTITPATEPKYEQVTLRNFERFQSKIFPIVQNIIQASKSSKFKFCEEWNALLKSPNLTFDGNTTFCDIKKEL